MNNRFKLLTGSLLVLILMAVVQCGDDKSTGGDDEATTLDNRIVYSTRYDGMFLVNSDGSGKKLLVDDDSCWAAVWSPNKTLVAFTRLISGSGYQIRAVDTATLDVQYVAYGTYGYNPWSPDGNTLVYDNNNSVNIKSFGSLYSVSVLDNAFDAVFLNNDTLIMLHYHSGNTDSTFIYKISTGGSGLTALANTAGYRFRLPRLSPNRDIIAYVRIHDGNFDDSNQVWIMNTDGSNKIQLGEIDGFIREMSFSHDGSKLLLVPDNDDVTRVQRLDIAAHTVTVLTDAYSEDGEWAVDYAPDQSKLVLNLYDGGVAVMNDNNTGAVDTLDTLGFAPNW
ncbi:MAG: hypothetical protein JXA92_03380 [candidate division Zixibacteria bacterium]|nr:hypothetical protein [candidate division Zixibacteria bacterium]